MTGRDAVIECFRRDPGRSLSVADVRAWMGDRYPGRFKAIGTTLADLVVDGNNSSKYPRNQQFLERVGRGVYRMAGHDPEDRQPPAEPADVRYWPPSEWKAQLRSDLGNDVADVFEHVEAEFVGRGYVLHGSHNRVRSTACVWPAQPGAPNGGWPPPACFRLDGRVEIPLRYLRDYQFEDGVELAQRLSRVPGVNIDPEAARPTFDLSLLGDRLHRNLLADTFEWGLGRVVHEVGGPSPAAAAPSGLVDQDGAPVDADFRVEQSEGELTVLFESRGGKPLRNTQYNTGLRLVLERLGGLGAVLTDAALATRDTRDRRLEERRLHPDGFGYPVKLGALEEHSTAIRAPTGSKSDAEPGAGGATAAVERWHVQSDAAKGEGSHNHHRGGSRVRVRRRRHLRRGGHRRGNRGRSARPRH